MQIVWLLFLMSKLTFTYLDYEQLLAAHSMLTMQHEMALDEVSTVKQQLQELQATADTLTIMKESLTLQLDEAYKKIKELNNLLQETIDEKNLYIRSYINTINETGHTTGQSIKKLEQHFEQSATGLGQTIDSKV